MDEQHWKAMLEAVEAAYAAASGTWTGAANWPHEYLDDGVWQPCPGGGHEADCYACAMPAKAAHATEAAAAIALEAARAGDWAMAAALAQCVTRLEAARGGERHTPVWGAFILAIIAAADVEVAL